MGDRNDRGFPQGGEIDLSHKHRENIAHYQTEQHGQLLEVGLRENVEQDTAEQRYRAEDPVFRRAEICTAATAAERGRSDCQQRKADRRDHAGGHDRGNDPDPELRKKSQYALHYAADEHGSHNRSIAVLGTDKAQHRHKGEADAHDDRQSGTNFMENRKQLHQRADTGNQHGTLDQHCHIRSRQSAGSAYNQNRGNICHEHGEDMLQAKGNRLMHRHHAVQLVQIRNGSFSHRLFHAG